MQFKGEEKNDFKSPKTASRAILPFSGTRFSSLSLHSSQTSLATSRISFQSFIISSFDVCVDVTVNRITYLPLRDAGTACRLPRWFNRFNNLFFFCVARKKERIEEERKRIEIYWTNVSAETTKFQFQFTFSVSSLSPRKRNTTMPIKLKRD